MTRRQVLILYRGSLLAEGIQSLLRNEKGLDVTSLRMAGETPAFFGSELTPDVIIVDTCDLRGPKSLLVIQLLREHPRAKVICLNAEDSKVEVYRKDERTASKREDLVEAIRSA